MAPSSSPQALSQALASWLTQQDRDADIERLRVCSSSEPSAPNALRPPEGAVTIEAKWSTGETTSRQFIGVSVDEAMDACRTVSGVPVVRPQTPRGGLFSLSAVVDEHFPQPVLPPRVPEAHHGLGSHALPPEPSFRKMFFSALRS